MRKIVKEHANEKVSPLLAYKMMKLIKASDNEDAFYYEKLNEIINKYSRRDDEGKVLRGGEGILLDQNHIEDCKNAVEELESTEVETPNVRFFIAELGELKLSINDIFVIESLITEEDSGA
jgi:hypothetical protein